MASARQELTEQSNCLRTQMAEVDQLRRQLHSLGTDLTGFKDIAEAQAGAVTDLQAKVAAVRNAPPQGGAQGLQAMHEVENLRTLVFDETEKLHATVAHL